MSKQHHMDLTGGRKTFHFADRDRVQVNVGLV